MLMAIFVVNIATPPWILGLQSRDQTAMFSVETIAKCRSSLMGQTFSLFVIVLSTNMAALTSAARYVYEQYVLLSDDQEFHLLCNKRCQLHRACEQAVITSLVKKTSILPYSEIVSNSRSWKSMEQYLGHMYSTVILNTVKGFNY